MQLADYWRVLRMRWPLLVITTLVGALLGLGISMLQPKAFTATAQNFVAISSTSSVNDNILGGAQFIQQRVNSYGQLVTSPKVLDPVIAELGLPLTSQQLSSKVSASSPPLTVLINVTATYGDAAMTARIANATAEQLGKTIEALETPKGASAAPVKVSLTDPAETPASPSAPKTLFNTLLGLLLGLLAGLAYVLLREALDTTLNHEEDVVGITGATPLAI
ncbi:MAG: Wzz/FepE/Etk N-terminal domain-containing protein, partial [Actinomycetes bacterium]